MSLGSFTERDGRAAVRFDRTFAHPVAEVWAAVSTPEGLAHWFPSQVHLEPRPGGAISFSGDPHTADIPGEVLVFEPPHHFAFTWGANQVHLELAPDGAGGCRLTLTDVLGARDEAARNGAGWTVCLEELRRWVDEGHADGPHSASAIPWQPLFEAHVAAGLPSGAGVPTV
ncbi:MAG: hypothetical protein JWM48_1915 [Mycobacterium sp.]|nr:hypothetical protein [Mycobacterium sp.]